MDGRQRTALPSGMLAQGIPSPLLHRPVVSQWLPGEGSFHNYCSWRHRTAVTSCQHGPIPSSAKNCAAKFGSPGELPPCILRYRRKRSKGENDSEWPSSRRNRRIFSPSSIRRAATEEANMSRNGFGWLSMTASFCPNIPHRPEAHSCKAATRFALNCASSI